MKRTIIVCDVCGRDTLEPLTFDMRLASARGDVVRNVEICSVGCVVRALSAATADLLTATAPGGLLSCSA